MNNLIKSSLLILGALTSSVSIANQLFADFLKKEIKLAHSQYLHGSPESGLYTLHALARLLESDSSSSLEADIGPDNLSFTYLRIAMLHEKAGNSAKAETYFNKVISTYDGRNVEIAELKAFVTKLDEINIKSSRV